ncbi:hypothetical protein ACGF12_35890 [Kitasatospora sp. NPDC048296]|uniref:hypothetical protein n=1 Tax=Kitasatospora sp. NPDC048296 TaxID=3364048 RepID=UPI003720F76A
MTDVPPLSPWKWLEQGGMPTKGRGDAKLKPLQRLRPMPPMIKEVHVPAWDWKSPHFDRTAKTIELDRTASWPSAASSTFVAFGALKQTGPIPFDQKRAGYWLVDFTGTDDQEGHRDRWARKDIIMSPLGTGRPRLKAWLCHPTARLLDDLAEAGEFAPLRILDSWTSTETVRLSKWSEGIRNHIDALKDAHLDERLAEFKDDYAATIQMLLSGEGFAYRRPDWYHAILTQHARNAWWDLYGTAKLGHGPVACHEVDAALYLPEDYDALTMHPENTLKIDLTGRKFGTWKIKV